MNNLKEYIFKNLVINEKLIINKNTKIDKYHYHPKNKDELHLLINKLIKERGENADLNDIDTSKIDNMGGMFLNSDFNGDISEWDVSNVTNMVSMFEKSEFTGDISKWNVSNVKDMKFMFYGSKFNGDISNWDVINVKNMGGMFGDSPLEKNPPKWYKKS